MNEDPDFAALIAARPHLSLHAMDGLVMEDVPLTAIADAVGTPVWVTSAGAMRARVALLARALADAGLGARVHYAVKANDHLAVLGVMAAAGVGADVVSGGELLRARRAGIAATDIVFSGVGKTEAELRLALNEGIAQLNVESAEELAMVAAVAASLARTAPVVLRVNPDVDAGTHEKITTGRAGNKFGIPYDEAAALYAHAAALPWVEPVGLAVHIGSQITAMAPYRAAFARLASLVRTLRAQGYPVRRLDCGGGLGIAYRNELPASPAAFAGAIAAELGGLDLQLMVEPGRWLVGPAGVLLASVILVKHGARPVVVLDAAMNELVRPAMYGAWHGIVPLSAADAAVAVTPADVVGPVCETGDTFARGRALPPLSPRSRVAILDAGAYGAVMSSTYNARPMACQVLVEGARWAVISRRQTVEELWEREQLPDWLAGERMG